MIDRLFFDIETAPLPGRVALLPDPKAPGNLTDPFKIAEAIEIKRRKQSEQAALDPDTAQVVAIGMFYKADRAVYLQGDPEAWDETHLLKKFWDTFDNANGFTVGYNTLGFDFPFLLRRSMALRVDVPHIPDLARYRSQPTRDLYAILYNWQPGKSLHTVAQLYDLFAPDTRCDDFSIPGPDLADLFYTDPEQLRAKCYADLCITWHLNERMTGIYF